MPIGTVRAGAAVNRSGTTITVPVPASVVAGELLILHWGAAGSGSLTTPAGWTQQADVADGTSTRVTVLTKVAAGTESGTIVFTQSNNSASGQMFAVPGVHPSTPMDAAAQTAATSGSGTATLVLPSITAVTDGSLPFYAVNTAAGGTSFTGPAGSTELADWLADLASAEMFSAVYRDTATVLIGATGTRTVTPSSSRRMAGAILLLRPSGVSGTLPVTLGLTATVVSVLTVTGTTPVTLGLTSVAVMRLTATGTLPLTVGLVGFTGAYGSLPLTVGLVGFAGAIVPAVTGTLPVALKLRGVAVVSANAVTGRLDANLALVGTVTAKLTATGTLPLTVGLVGVGVNGRTRVEFTLLDDEGAPRPRVHVRVRLVPPAYLLDDRELEAPYETYSDTAGLVTLNLTAVSQIAVGALYAVTYDGRTRFITVPEGGPFDLFDLLVPSVGGAVTDDGTFAVVNVTALDDGTFAAAGTAAADDGMF